MITDGTGVASPVLKDARAVYTPGISERASGTSKFYHGDALGSTRGITNGSQTVTDAVLYDAFGMTVSRTGSTATPFGFVGAAQYQTDADSGLQLLGHRMYDPSVGRFISSDPIQDGDNWYAYCENNPLTGTDPNGLQTIPSGWDDDGNGNAVGPGFNPRLARISRLRELYVPPDGPLTTGTPPLLIPAGTAAKVAEEAAGGTVGAIGRGLRGIGDRLRTIGRRIGIGRPSIEPTPEQIAKELEKLNKDGYGYKGPGVEPGNGTPIWREPSVPPVRTRVPQEFIRHVWDRFVQRK